MCHLTTYKRLWQAIRCPGRPRYTKPGSALTAPQNHSSGAYEPSLELDLFLAGRFAPDCQPLAYLPGCGRDIPLALVEIAATLAGLGVAGPRLVRWVSQWMPPEEIPGSHGLGYQPAANFTAFPQGTPLS